MEDLLPAIEKALKEDTEIIIETALIGVEVSVGVYTVKDEVMVFSPTEIVSENEFFDYEAKYIGESRRRLRQQEFQKKKHKKFRMKAKRIYHY